MGVPDGMAIVAAAPKAVMVYWLVESEVGVIVPPAAPVMVADVLRMVPDTSNLTAGEAVPIPTLPLELMVIRGVGVGEPSAVV